MARTIWCRLCGYRALVTAGALPARCDGDNCSGGPFWSTEPVTALMKDRRNGKRPRVPFDITIQDRMLFLRRVRISGD